MDSDAERRGWRGGMEVRGPHEPQRTEQEKDLCFPEISQNYTSKRWNTTINSCPANQKKPTTGQWALSDSLHGQSTLMTNPNQWRCFNGQKKQREQYTSLTSGGGGVWGGGGYFMYIKKNETEGKLS